MSGFRTSGCKEPSIVVEVTKATTENCFFFDVRLTGSATSSASGTFAFLPRPRPDIPIRLSASRLDSSVYTT